MRLRQRASTSRKAGEVIGELEAIVPTCLMRIMPAASRASPKRQAALEPQRGAGRSWQYKGKGAKDAGKGRTDKLASSDLWRQASGTFAQPQEGVRALSDGGGLRPLSTG